MQFYDGTLIHTIIMPTGSYTVGGSSDIGNRVATAMTDASTLTITASYDTATNLYTFNGSSPFRFVFSDNTKKYITRQLGFTTATQTLKTSQTATFIPKFYDNDFLMNIDADNATTNLVSIPHGINSTIRASFIIPKTADYGQQLYLTMNQITPQRICFSRSPSRIS